MPDTQRIRRYENLKKVLEERGRLPFYKQYHKYAKLMMFFYETLMEITMKNGLQNRDGVLFKVKLSHYSTRHNSDLSGRLLFECGCGSYALIKSFEVEHTSKETVATMLEDFANYYGLVFKKKDEKYYSVSGSYDYKISLP